MTFRDSGLLIAQRLLRLTHMNLSSGEYRLETALLQSIHQQPTMYGTRHFRMPNQHIA
ncbi:MAG: hypothetical protein LZF86_190373 [Nitrospira sp.]|nr:MAG: hypothetical protein LZF86_190373 [Nitrospira sp.]